MLLGRYAQQRGLGLASDADLVGGARGDGRVRRRRSSRTGASTSCRGGEARRVILAQALCQGARLPVLDEPTAGLDPAHARVGVRGGCARTATPARAAVVVTHDLDLALRYGTRDVAGRRAGGWPRAGPPRDVLASAATRDAFELDDPRRRRCRIGHAVRGARSERVRRRARPPADARAAVAVVGACALAAAVVAILAPLVGSEVGRDGFHLELLGSDALEPGTIDHSVLMLRLPRVLAALLIGGALAGAGCALQALLRNPLAEPFTLGISSGSSLAAVLAIRFGVEQRARRVRASASAALARRGRSRCSRSAQLGAGRARSCRRRRCILAGVDDRRCSARRRRVLVQYTSDFADVSHMLRWMIGGLDSTRLVVRRVAPRCRSALGLVVLVVYARELNALAAGPEAAASLGVAVARTAGRRVRGVVAARRRGDRGRRADRLRRADRAARAARAGRRRSPRAAAGVDVRRRVLLAVCDTLARTITSPAPLPTGAVTAVLGGPFFVAILVGNKRKAAMWSALRRDRRRDRVRRDGEAAARARARFADEPVLEALAGSLAAAQHGLPRARHRALLIGARDGALAAATAMAAIADGSAAVAGAARDGRASIVVADAGCDPALPEPAIRLGDQRAAGAALVVSLAEAHGGLDVLALGAIDDPIELLAEAILAAASMSAAIILDGDATGSPRRPPPLAAARARLPDRGPSRQPRTAIRALGLDPIFEVGLGHGEGTGAAMVLPLLDRVRARTDCMADRKRER